MSMSSPERVRRRQFTVLLIVCIVVSLALQMRTGSSYAELILLIPAVALVTWMTFAVVRARRARRASGAPIPQRVKWPVTFLLATVVVLLGGVAMLALTLTHEGNTLEQRGGAIVRLAEGAIILLALSLPQWQRSIVRQQRPNDPQWK